MARFELLIIDPQNDFVLPAPEGALSVGGAVEDMARLAGFIERIKLSPSLGDVHVTLDTHHLLHIAQPGFWVDAQLQPPPPFTIITESDVASGRWRARFPALQRQAEGYVRELAQKKRYALCVWPPHCLIGHPGHNVYEPLREALDGLERASPHVPLVDYVTKGSNFMTEHYGAVQAEVPDPFDSSTGLNTRLIDALSGADRVFIAGEALSHCVANTVRDVANTFGEDNIKKLVLLEDCASSVGGFEQLGKDFVREMTARGMQVVSSADAVAAFI